MHIWSLNRLKEDLIGPGLPDRENLPYLLAVLVCVSTVFVALPRHNLWSVVYGITFLVSLVLGIVVAYRNNGGSRGHDFLSRLFSLSVVCGLRWLLWFVLPLSLLAVAVPGTPWALTYPGDPSRLPMGRYDVLMLLMVVPPLIWMVAVQMRDVASRSRDRGVEDPVRDGPGGLEPLED